MMVTVERTGRLAGHAPSWPQPGGPRAVMLTPWRDVLRDVRLPVAALPVARGRRQASRQNVP